jgi:hypothetical protein
MLMAQGLAWLVLATGGLAAWIATFPQDLNVIGAGGAILWTGVELLGIILAVYLGAAEVGMACRMQGGYPRPLLAASVGLQGLMLALALLLAALLVTIGGSMLELMAVGTLDALLSHRPRLCTRRREALAYPGAFGSSQSPNAPRKARYPRRSGQAFARN